jgi:phage replication-related protein YjqB (UPF0714/DUF867 family)
MPDKYANFEDLRLHVPPGDYAIEHERRPSDVVIIAPHGGGIEPGTLELARAIAGTEYSYYAFDAKREHNNAELHVTSTHFDEPLALCMASNARLVLTVHGCGGGEEEGCEDGPAKTTLYLGGLDEVLIGRLNLALAAGQFDPQTSDRLRGTETDNICNRGATGKGAQLELPKGLRTTMFADLTTRQGRLTTTAVFARFVAAIRGALVS